MISTDFSKMKIKAIIAAVVLIIGLPLMTIITKSTYRETVYPQATKLFYVDDYAHVLSEDAETFILDEALKLHDNTKAQVVVVTVPNTGTQSLEQYSIGLANEWGIGDKELNNGVLLLFTTEDPHVRIEVGKGLEGALPDGKAGRILDKYAVAAKDKRKWDEAAVKTFIAIVEEVYKEYQIDINNITYDNEYQINVTSSTKADSSFPDTVKVDLTLLAALWIACKGFMPYYAIFLFILFGGRHMLYYGGHSSGGGFGGFSGGGGSFGGGGASR